MTIPHDYVSARERIERRRGSIIARAYLAVWHFLTMPRGND